MDNYSPFALDDVSNYNPKISLKIENTQLCFLQGVSKKEEDKKALLALQLNNIVPALFLEENLPRTCMPY